MTKTIPVGVENDVWPQLRKNYLGFAIVGALAVAGSFAVANYFQSKKDETPIVASSQPSLEERVAIPEQKPPEISPEILPYFERAIEYLKETYGLSEDQVTLYSYVHKTIKWDWNLITKKGDFGYLFLFRSSTMHLGLVVDPQSVISEEFKYPPSERERGVIQALEESIGHRLIVYSVRQTKLEDIIEAPTFAEYFPKPVSNQLFCITYLQTRGDSLSNFETNDYYFDFEARIIFGHQSSM